MPTGNPDTPVLADGDLAGFTRTERAPAKINLALHVTGRRADGYHLLDMLVTFTRFGDRLGLSPDKEDHLTLSGRFASAIAPGSDNLVVRARDLLRAALARHGRPAPPVHLHLEKNLPVASGIGGGSADAAATLRGLSRLWKARLAKGELAELALKLGADVPMCLDSVPVTARGVGEEIEALPDLPVFAMVLANPLVAVPTPDVFRALASRTNPPMALARGLRCADDWLEALAETRNDLEAPARALCPQIDEVSALLSASGARFVRMSGSGATCFGIYGSVETAEAAAGTLREHYAGWFFAATETVTGGSRPWDA
ncbi:MAG: 4-(cytidine 5'-diphospho)-2-C-methyl-D-erythritol kinase [Shinella sp.]|nr:4-(cytidine 5'-diphospho)-2-C-methyl-D-erythritol kinase [Shinella sp.]